MAPVIPAAAAAAALLFSVLIVAPVTAATSPTCTVSNGVVTLFNAEPNIKCAYRPDIDKAYIPTGSIPSMFIYGATAASSSVSIEFFTDSSCTMTANPSHIICQNLPNSQCAASNGSPVLYNVGPPAMCIKRDDTGETFQVPQGIMHAVNVTLGGPILSGYCPVQVNLFKDSDCVHYLATQEITCPCTCD